MKDKTLLIVAALLAALSSSVVANYDYSSYKNSNNDLGGTNSDYWEPTNTEGERYSYITDGKGSDISSKLEYSFGYGYDGVNIQSSYNSNSQEIGYNNPTYIESLDISDRLGYSFGYGYDTPLKPVYTEMNTGYNPGSANYINPMGGYTSNKPTDYYYNSGNMGYNSRYSYSMYEKRESDYYSKGYKQKDTSMMNGY